MDDKITILVSIIYSQSKIEYILKSSRFKPHFIRRLIDTRIIIINSNI